MTYQLRSSPQLRIASALVCHSPCTPGPCALRL